MAETKKTKGIEVEKYGFYVPEDPKAAEAEASKAWNHRKLKKVIMNDYILSYQELLEMKLIYESQLEDSERDLEILLEKVEATKKRIEEHKNKVKEWNAEIAMAEKDIPEIGEIAKKERTEDEKKRAAHEANLRGEGEGRALGLDEDGNFVDLTGSKK